MSGVLFLCVHNAGRSQMAAGFAREMSSGLVNVFSGGSEPADSVNQVAVAAMAEVGIDIGSFVPQLFDLEMLDEVDVVVTMGCGDTCPYVPVKRYVDWPLADPRGLPLEQVRPIRDEIRKRVEELLGQL